MRRAARKHLKEPRPTSESSLPRGSSTVLFLDVLLSAWGSYSVVHTFELTLKSKEFPMGPSIGR